MATSISDPQSHVVDTSLATGGGLGFAAAAVLFAFAWVVRRVRRRRLASWPVPCQETIAMFAAP